MANPVKRECELKNIEQHFQNFKCFQGTVEELHSCFVLKQRKWDPSVENGHVKNTDDNVSLTNGSEALLEEARLVIAETWC